MESHKLTTQDILKYRAGTSKDFSKLFHDLCQVAGIYSKVIQGIAKKSEGKTGK